MSSLGEIQQIYNMLHEIDRLLDKIETKSKTTDRQLTKTIVNIEILERTLREALRLTARLTGDENLQRASTTAAQAIGVFTQFQMAATLMLSANPYLLPLGIISSTTAALSMSELAGSFT